MAGNTIGGFFVELGVITKQASITAATTALFGVAKAAAALETAELKTAKAIGISTQSLNAWKTSAAIAGGSAASLVSSMNQIESKMQRLKMGQIDTGMATNLARLGIGYGDFAKMDANQRMSAVFNQAGRMQDQQLAAQLISDTLGQGAREYYDYLKLSGKSLSQALAEGRALTFTTAATKREAMLFNGNMNAIGQATKSIGALFGSKLAGALNPIVQKTKEWIIGNRELIQSGVTQFAEGLGKTLTAIFGAASSVLKVVGGLVNKLGGLDKVLVKVAVGVAAIKSQNILGGIRGIISGIGGIRNALNMGFKGTALYLLLDDLMTYFTGGDSVTGDIVDFVKDIAAAFNFPGLADGFVNATKEMLESFNNLVTTLTGNEKINDFFKKIGTTIVTEICESLANTIELTTALIGMIDGLLDWDEEKLKESGQKLGASLTNSIEKTVDFFLSPGRFLGEKIRDAIQKRRENGTGREMQDGIMRPDGTITQVAPDDWVFAARNVSDLAAAFIPEGAASYSSGATIINQNITVNGARDLPATIKQKAYEGARAGLQDGTTRTVNILQRMSGLA